MLTEGTRRMLAEGKRYEAMRVREAPAWVQVIVFALAVAAVGGLFMLTGCAAPRPVPVTAAALGQGGPVTAGGEDGW